MTKPDLVLIDDDLLVHDAWKYVASQKGKTLLCYEDPSHFKYDVEKDVPIYVDFLIAGQRQGAIIADRLIRAGYENVFITTGYPEDTIPRPLGLKGVISKMCPIF